MVMTCWEVFSLGRTPYSVIDPMALVDLLEGGGRFKKPNNAVYTHQM